MRYIKVPIDCTETHCWDCEFLDEAYDGSGVCSHFDVFQKTDESGHFLRLPECLAAEVKEETK